MSLSLQEMYLLLPQKRLHVLNTEGCTYPMQESRSSMSRNLNDSRIGLEVSTGVKGTAGTFRDTLRETTCC